MIFAVTAYLQVYCFVHANDDSNYKVDDKMSSKTIKNISDDKLVEDFNTFINDNGIRRDRDTKVHLRNPYHFPPSERALNLKVLDMMKQAIYDSQDNMKVLEPILEKYKNDPSLRMAFIFDRLRQLIIDIRRVYTLAIKWRPAKRMWEQIVWYTYCVRKHIDVLYIVEHLIDLHIVYMKIFKGQ